MGKLRKIIFLVVLVAIAYFAAEQLGFIGAGQIKNIDEKYQIGAEKLVPAIPVELESYEKELRSLNPLGDEKEVVLLKLELVEMQKQMNIMIENQAKIDLQQIDCRTISPISKARIAAERAIEHADNALERKRHLSKNLSGFGYLIKSDFEDTINAVKTSLQETISTLKIIC